MAATGTGKTFTMAKLIEETQRPAIILAPNKTLAAQLYGEFKGFFPDNAVEYFVSYYDYYQPEAYVARSDTYIEKESQINEQIDRMRHSATRAARARRRHHRGLRLLHLRHRLGRDLRRDDAGSACRAEYDQRKVMADLVAQQYRRNDQASRAAPSACAATAWRSGPRTWTTAPGGCPSSARSWRRSPSSTR